MTAGSPRWYAVANVEDIPSPALLVYPDRVEENIRRMIRMAGGTSRLRPHMKTNKLPEVIRMHLDAGITKFKCATIAETEMVAAQGGLDILFAYQPVGPNIGRFIQLIRTFPETTFSALVDDEEVIRGLSAAAVMHGVTANLYLDLDVGMHRSGVAPGPRAVELYRLIDELPGLAAAGLHAYDGHLHDTDPATRQRRCDEAFAPVLRLRDDLIGAGLPVPAVVAGGTPTFPIHARRPGVECSPGTTVFWDLGYTTNLPDLSFLPAVLLLTRVISKPGADRLCLDLGHKALASEMPHPRMSLMDVGDVTPLGHSEEHLPIETPRASEFPVGTALYAMPWHVCPTVALHNEAVVIRDGRAAERWRVLARARTLTISVSPAIRMSHSTGLLVYALIAVVGLVILIARFKLNSFVALVAASLFVGAASGMKLTAIGQAFQDGVGAVLGSIATVVGLGIILGRMLEESGGAHVVASTLIRALGDRRLHWTMLLVALIVGIPVFFTVGLVLLTPIVFAVARETRAPLLFVGIPLLAGLSVMHGLVPPHPGPMVAAGLFKADIGRTILYSLLVGIPTSIIAGPLFGTFIARRLPIAVPAAAAGQAAATEGPGSLPGFGLTLFTILLPVALMLTASLADITLPVDHRLRQAADFAGHPVVAMLVAVLFSFYSFGTARGFSRDQILRFSNECLAPAAAILLVVGAGGGFNRVLVNSGVGGAIAALATESQLSILVLGWLVAALIRVATGSATVAITTAAGIIAPIAATSPAASPELLVLAMGAGSLIMSHVNDAGFWFVKEYFGMTVSETLRTWTVMETIIAVVALAFILLLDLVV